MPLLVTDALDFLLLPCTEIVLGLGNYWGFLYVVPVPRRPTYSLVILFSLIWHEYECTICLFCGTEMGRSVFCTVVRA